MLECSGDGFLPLLQSIMDLCRQCCLMIPRDWSASKKPAIIMEFKVYDAESEQSLEGTVKAALAQIEEKAYDAELTTRGIASENIRHYGFAFEGKKVLIG